MTLVSLTSAFGAFANAGVLAHPRLIRRVTASDGKVLYESPAAFASAVSATTAFLLTSMLEDVVNAGTAAQARQLGFRLPAAGKTGTTNDYRDAWFVGYTPRLVTGVWVGYDEPRTIMRGGYAAELAVPLAFISMLRAREARGSGRRRALSPLTSTRRAAGWPPTIADGRPTRRSGPNTSRAEPNRSTSARSTAPTSCGLSSALRRRRPRQCHREVRQLPNRQR